MTKRPEEITNEFLKILDNNLQELIDGKSDDYLGIHKIAEMLFIHPTHLSNTIKDVTGKSPCDICNERTIAVSKKLLKDQNFTIADIGLEAGLNYRYNIGNKEKWGLSKDRLNDPGGVVSIVGNISL